MKYYNVQVKEDEMRRSCSKHQREGECIQDFGGRTRIKESTRKTQTQVEGKSLWYASCCGSYNNVNMAVYTTMISTRKMKLILSYQHTYFGQSVSLHILTFMRSSLGEFTGILELCFLIWIHIITIYFILIAKATFLLNII
jgi:hypothetical protein